MVKINKLISGIKITPLKQIEDKRGAVFHVLKRSSPHFSKFGEVYISKVNPNVIKAWKYHKEMTQNFSVPFGKLKLVIFDDRKNSSSYGEINEFFLDPEENYNLITIPPRVWYGFQCIGETHCLLLNVADLEHNPLESLNKDVVTSNINYQWDKD